MRILVLCTHNSARSQMAEGWLRHYARASQLDATIFSAGTEQTKVKADAITVMAEVSIDLSDHTSKTLYDVPDPWNFDVVLTVCDDANETCPAYPAQTNRLHISFPDPSGQGLERWREVRDSIGSVAQQLISLLQAGKTATEAGLRAAL